MTIQGPVRLKKCKNGLFLYTKNDIYVGRSLDLYGEWLDEQWINIDPNLCNGDYWIVGIADPNNYYLEENDDNNYTAIPVTLYLQNESSTSTINVTGDVQICEGEDIELTANYGDSYLWSTGETTQSIMVSEAGNYSVTVQNSNCSFVYTSPETNVSEVIVDAPTVVNPTSTSCLGEALSIELNVEDANWYNEDQELIYTGNTYYLPILEEDLHLYASQIAQSHPGKIYTRRWLRTRNQYRCTNY